MLGQDHYSSGIQTGRLPAINSFIDLRIPGDGRPSVNRSYVFLIKGLFNGHTFIYRNYFNTSNIVNTSTTVNNGMGQQSQSINLGNYKSSSSSISYDPKKYSVDIVHPNPELFSSPDPREWKQAMTQPETIVITTDAYSSNYRMAPTVKNSQSVVDANKAFRNADSQNSRQSITVENSQSVVDASRTFREADSQNFRQSLTVGNSRSIVDANQAFRNTDTVNLNSVKNGQAVSDSNRAFREADSAATQRQQAAEAERLAQSTALDNPELYQKLSNDNYYLSSLIGAGADLQQNLFEVTILPENEKLAEQLKTLRVNPTFRISDFNAPGKSVTTVSMPYQTAEFKRILPSSNLQKELAFQVRCDSKMQLYRYLCEMLPTDGFGQFDLDLYRKDQKIYLCDIIVKAYEMGRSAQELTVSYSDTPMFGFHTPVYFWHSIIVH